MSLISEVYGFLSKMEFSFYIYLFTLISIFENIENLNKALNTRESHIKIEVARNLVLENRNNFPQRGTNLP